MRVDHEEEVLIDKNDSFMALDDGIEVSFDVAEVKSQLFFEGRNNESL